MNTQDEHGGKPWDTGRGRTRDKEPGNVTGNGEHTGRGAHREWMTDLARVINDPGYERWRSLVAATGGCAHPVHLVGASLVVQTETGEILRAYQTSDEPGGVLLVACGNRRASVCPACAQTYQADTYQLIRAGLSGGKGIPEEVSSHPRVFCTLTAPSFGPVHTRREQQGKALPCRPRSGKGRKACEHGRPVGCGMVHDAQDERLGQPICPDCYDYRGAVLWQAHAGVLWHRFMVALRRELARQAGMAAREMASWVRVSFAKVAEYQRRGLVHFHAVIRLDGAEGPGDFPPDWADHGMLVRAIGPAARAVEVTSPESGLGRWRLAWGDQIDIRPIVLGAALDGVSEEGVASYISKYATKGSDGSAALDFRISCRQCRGLGRASRFTLCAVCHGTGLKDGLLLDALPVTEHARRMIRTCWELGKREEFGELRLRPWAHMLGFRGHFSSKSRRFSVTLGDLRQARSTHRAQEARDREGLPPVEDGTTAVVAHWRFAGTGYTPGEAVLAEFIRQRVTTARQISAERARQDKIADNNGNDEGDMS